MMHKSRCSSVTIVTGYGLDDGCLGVRFPAGAGKFVFSTAFRPALGHTQPAIQRVSGEKRPGREAEHSSASSAEVKECVALYFHPQHVFMAWCLVKHRDNCTFTLNFTFYLITLE